MAARSLLDRFRSISRPSLTTSSSGAFSSLAKKQASAEDLMVDNLYKEGGLSIEAYLDHLNQRLERPWNTPRTQVSLQEKIESANEDLIDAEVDRAYQAGEISTNARYEYELDKLNRMTETDSTAYLNQSRLVSSLKDKAEKEARTELRIQKLNELSQMPEDTSEKLWQKASLYETLAQQARLDGDEQQALSLSTQANNYQASAKRAEINDFITGARLQVSETPRAGLGVPGAEEGQRVFSELTGSPAPTASQPDTTSSGQEAESGTVSSGMGLTGFSGSNSAVNSGLERLDRQQKSLERMYAQRADKMILIDAYQQAVAAADGDQKTSLTIALNNLQDDIAGLDNQIAIATNNIEETVGDINAAQTKAAASAFNQERRLNERELSKAEDELEQAFKDGDITKAEYVGKGILLAQAKAQFFDQASQVYNQFGNDSSADSYLDKAEDMIRIHESLISVGQNIDDYEPIFVDSESPLINLLGEKTGRGDILLTDVRNLKQSGRFEDNYTLVDGVWHKVYYPAEYVDSSGFLNTGISGKELARIRNEGAYINKLDEDSGKMLTEPVKFVELKNEAGEKRAVPMTVSNIEKSISEGLLETDKQGNIKQYEAPNIVEQTFLKAGAGAQQFLEKNVPGIKKVREEIDKSGADSGAEGAVGRYMSFVNDFYAPKVEGAVSFVTDAYTEKLPNLVNNYLDFAKEQYTETLPELVNKGKTFVSNSINRVGNFFGNLVPEAKAAEPETEIDIDQRRREVSPVNDGFVEGTPLEYQNLIAEAANKYGLSTALLSSLIKQESNFNPNAVSPVGAVGLTQLMPETAKELGVRNSRDPKQAVEGGARYLKQKIDEFGGDINLGLAAYNAGAGNVRKYGGIPPFRETQNYVEKITGLVKNAIVPPPIQPDQLNQRNLNRALGFEPDATDVNPSQEQIDRAFRSNNQDTIKLLEGAGYKRSDVQPTSTPAPVVTAQPDQTPQPTRRSDSGSGNISVTGKPIQDYFRPANIGKTVTNAASNIGSGLTDFVSNATKNIGNTIRDVGDSVPDRYNVPKQAQALFSRDYLTDVAAPAVKNTAKNVGDFFKKLNPFK